MPHGQKNGERHKSLGFCVTPNPRSNFFLPGVKKIYLLTKRFLLNVSVFVREGNCSKNWIFRRRGISPCSMNDAIEGERASLIFRDEKSIRTRRRFNCVKTKPSGRSKFCVLRRRECFYECEVDYVRRLVKRRTMSARSSQIALR